MYGKIFSDIFGSTLAEFGGDTMYVLMSMVVLSDSEGYLRMTLKSFARLIRKEVEIVGQAVTNLESIDLESSSLDYEGRRIIKLSEVTLGQENRGWWVINKVKYAQIASQKDRATQNCQAQQRFRDKVENSKQPSATVSNRKQPSAENRHIDVDVDVDVNKPKRLGQNDFDPFWSIYPKKVKRKKAFEIWKRKKLDSKAPMIISDIKNRLVKDSRWLDGYIPDPTTYLNGELWDDEVKSPRVQPENFKSNSQIMRIGSQSGLSPRRGETMEEYATRIRTTRR